MTANIFDPRSKQSWGEWLNLMPKDFGTTVVEAKELPVNFGINKEEFSIMEKKQLGSQILRKKDEEIATLKFKISEMEKGMKS